MKLTIVSTPIGNLKDISLRALEVLRSVDYILCEDTRRGRKLKTHYSLNPRLISFHEHNERERIPEILSLMKEGKTFALISDAGFPLLSDPGALLIQELIRNGIEFTCIPGASAVLAAVVMSGFGVIPFTFAGFLPVQEGDRKRALADLSALTKHTIVLFESPQRILSLLRGVGETLGDRQVCICRELTKLHEEILRGTVSELIEQLAPRRFRGEFTIVVGPGEVSLFQMTDQAVTARFEQLQREGLGKKEALRKLSRESGRSRNELYRLLMK